MAALLRILGAFHLEGPLAEHQVRPVIPRGEVAMPVLESHPLFEFLSKIAHPEMAP